MLFSFFFNCKMATVFGGGGVRWACELPVFLFHFHHFFSTLGDIHTRRALSTDVLNIFNICRPCFIYYLLLAQYLVLLSHISFFSFVDSCFFAADNSLQHIFHHRQQQRKGKQPIFSAQLNVKQNFICFDWKKSPLISFFCKMPYFNLLV